MHALVNEFVVIFHLRLSASAYSPEMSARSGIPQLQYCAKQARTVQGSQSIKTRLSPKLKLQRVNINSSLIVSALNIVFNLNIYSGLPMAYTVLSLSFPI